MLRHFQIKKIRVSTTASFTPCMNPNLNRYGISGFLAGIISSAKLFEFDDVFYVLISL